MSDKHLHIPDEELDALQNCRLPQGEGGVAMLKRMNDSHQPMTQWAFAQIPFGKRVLDVGCGGGNALKLALQARPDGAFVGVDYSMTALEESWELNHAAIEEKRLILVQASVEDLPFETGQFDTVYSIESYYFWPNLEADLRELCRVTAPGGTIHLIAEMVDGRLDEREEIIKEHLNMTILDAAILCEKVTHAGYSDVSHVLDEEHGWLLITGRYTPWTSEESAR